MKAISHKNLIIELIEENDYTLDSTDNVDIYEKIYINNVDGDKCKLPSLHGIKVFENEKETSRCLVGSSYGATGIHETCYLIDDNKLLLCCADSIFCLSIPNLNLVWKIKADDVTCFQIFKLQNDYIVHGELTVSRINKKGEIVWQIGGRDIFVSVDGNAIFKIHSDHILVSDFDNTVYKIDLDGKHIEEFKL